MSLMSERYRFHTRFSTFSNLADRVSLRIGSSAYDPSDRRQETRDASLMFERQQRITSQYSGPPVTTAEISAHLLQLSSQDTEIVQNSLQWVNERLQTVESLPPSPSSQKFLIEKLSQFDFTTLLIALFHHPHLPIVQMAQDCLYSYSMIFLTIR